MRQLISLGVLFLGVVAFTGLHAQSKSPTGVAYAPQQQLPAGGEVSGGNNSHLLLDDEGRVYPNPTNGPITLDFGTLGTRPFRVAVFNTLGQTVNATPQYHDDGRKIHVDLRGHTPGLYFFKAEFADRTVIKRFLLK